MVRIVSDSSTLFSTREAQSLGFDVRPLSVLVDGQSYKEFEQLETIELVRLIGEGHVPSSSQPAVGQVVDMYEHYPDEEIINISLADGLSGTYQSACMAKSMVDHGDQITVINSKTLCGPHRYLVETAVALAKTGMKKSLIVDEIEALIQTSTSFLIPQDFEYLVRGGRLSPLVGKIGGLVKLVPIMTLSEDATRLTKFSTKRTFKKAIQAISEDLLAKGVNEDYKVYISHACHEELAKEAEQMVKKLIEGVETEIMLLTPVFTAQGGHGCVAIQVIKKHPIFK